MNSNIARVVELTVAALCIQACPSLEALAAPPSIATVYDFQGGTDGATPSSGLVADKAGNLYGATLTGGSLTLIDGSPDKTCPQGCGTIFQLAPPIPPQTNWIKTIIATFVGGYDNKYIKHILGKTPMGSLALDPVTGIIYGATKLGGTYDASCENDDCGVVFSLSPPADGGTYWTKTIIVNFGDYYLDGIGSQPLGGVVLGAEGKLYGTTSLGGNFGTPNGYGTVFSIQPPISNSSSWKVRYLRYFQNSTLDGSAPLTSLSFVPNGNGQLYGTTSAGPLDANCGGSVFEIDLPAKFLGTDVVFNNLYHLAGNTIGCTLTGAPLLGGDGNVYGTTSDAGPQKAGAVFSLTPPAAGQTAWTASLIDSLKLGNKGSHPDGGVIADAHGKLYFSTAGYKTKTYPVRGAAVTELVPPAAGATLWTPKTLATFDGSNGGAPMSPLVIAPNGKIYGTTTTGGAYGYGTVFEVTR